MKCLIGVFFLIFAFSVHAKTVLRVGTWDYPPNMIIKLENNKPKFSGAIVDVWEKFIAPEAALEIQWIGPLPFPRAMQMLEEGSIDAVQHLSLTPERTKRFIFSKEPIMWGKQGIVVKKDEPLNQITKIDQLRGRTIGMIAQGYLAPFFQNNKSELKLEELSGIDSAQNHIRKLRSGRIWGIYFTFPDVLFYHATQIGKREELKLIQFPGSSKDEVTYAAFSKKLPSKLIQKLDKAIQKANDKYDYHQLANKYSRATSK